MAKRPAAGQPAPDMKKPNTAPAPSESGEEPGEAVDEELDPVDEYLKLLCLPAPQLLKTYDTFSHDRKAVFMKIVSALVKHSRETDFVLWDIIEENIPKDGGASGLPGQ